MGTLCGGGSPSAFLRLIARTVLAFSSKVVDRPLEDMCRRNALIVVIRRFSLLALVRSVLLVVKPQDVRSRLFVDKSHVDTFASLRRGFRVSSFT